MKSMLCLALVAAAGCLASGCATAQQRQLARNTELNDAFFDERVSTLKSLWNEVLARRR